jgi:hypothetical protein
MLPKSKDIVTMADLLSSPRKLRVCIGFTVMMKIYTILLFAICGVEAYVPRKSLGVGAFCC